MYYNESDGLYYTDEGFTTLANGFDWNGWSGYYIEGALTSLNPEGFGTWNDVFYAYGTPDSNFTGADPWDGYYYIASQLTTLDYDGNGEWNGDNYANGVIVIPAKNGWIDGVYYKNDVATTLDEDGNGTWNGVTFVNGARPDGLLAFYQLSDLTDSSGNGATLTNNGNVSFTSGKIGNAAVFDGSGWLSCPVPQPSIAVSVSAWVYLNDTNGPKFVVDSVTGNNWSGGGFGLITENGDVTMYVFYGGLGGGEGVGYSTPAGISLNTQQWYHIAGTYDTSTRTGKVFVDGILKNTQTFESGDPFGGNLTNPVGIGSNATGNWGLFDGQIDAVGIWNRALSDAEVAALYNNGTGLEVGGEAPAASLVRISGGSKFFGRVKFAV